MTDRVHFEMKYIGWNIGATRVERRETKSDIEILELTIDDVDILKQLEKAEKWDEVEPLLPKITAHLLIEYLKRAAESSIFSDVQSSEQKVIDE